MIVGLGGMLLLGLMGCLVCCCGCRLMLEELRQAVVGD
jgi:hypothetical protein